MTLRRAGTVTCDSSLTLRLRVTVGRDSSSRRLRPSLSPAWHLEGCVMVYTTPKVVYTTLAMYHGIYHGISKISRWYIPWYIPRYIPWYIPPSIWYIPPFIPCYIPSIPRYIPWYIARYIPWYIHWYIPPFVTWYICWYIPPW